MCFPSPSVMGGGPAAGDPSHSTYPQGTRLGMNTRVSLPKVKRSWHPAAPHGQGGQGEAQRRQVTLWETSVCLL